MNKKSIGLLQPFSTAEKELTTLSGLWETRRKLGMDVNLDLGHVQCPF